MSEEFHPVTRKKWMTRKNFPHRNRNVIKTDDNPDIDVEEFLKRLERLCQQMVSSHYFENAVSKLKLSLRILPSKMPLLQLICLGIGRFISNPQALHQLAFILELRKYFKINEALFFDPIHSSTEETILERVQCKTMHENREGKYLADVVTLFYMPHCPTCLTNNLLWRNWKPTLLSNVILINNSFTTICNNNAERFLRLEAEYILDVLAYAKELPLLDNYRLNGVFNDLSIHIFPTNQLPPSHCDLWIEKQAPVYSDVEMVSTIDFEKSNLSMSALRSDTKDKQQLRQLPKATFGAFQATSQPLMLSDDPSSHRSCSVTHPSRNERPPPLGSITPELLCSRESSIAMPVAEEPSREEHNTQISTAIVHPFPRRDVRKDSYGNPARQPHPRRVVRISTRVANHHSQNRRAGYNRCPLFMERHALRQCSRFRSQSPQPRRSCEPVAANSPQPINAESVTLQRTVAIIPTLRARVLVHGQIRQARALVNACEERSLISPQLVRKWNLQSTVVRSEQFVMLSLRAGQEFNDAIEFFAVVSTISPAVTPARTLDARLRDAYTNIRLADPDFYRSAEVSLVLGADVYSRIIRPGSLLTLPGQPVALNTVFGYMLTGNQLL